MHIDGVPIDGIPTQVVVHVSEVLAGIYIVFATVGFFFATLCLLFTVLYRNERYTQIKEEDFISTLIQFLYT